MSTKTEIEYAYQRGYAMVIDEYNHGGIKYSCESAWQKYCWSENRVRVQCRKVTQYLWKVQIWKQFDFPLTNADKAYFASNELHCEIVYWSWYAESEHLYALPEAKIICKQLVIYFDSIYKMLRITMQIA